MSATLALDRNRRVGLAAAGVALAMGAMGFAAVPLYRMFCQATGFAGTPQRASEAKAAGVKALARPISIRFDANVDPGMAWRFAPEQTTQQITIGARSLAIFTAENTSDHEITGAASFNVAPDEAARYFNKVQCFCFTLQRLGPHQKIRMPVSYYVDPAILADKDVKDLQQITLSYTFHPVPNQPKN
jgi:cytochrome c oxidase assembly protein subunit 11